MQKIKAIPVKIKFLNHSENFGSPKYQTEGAAGFDLQSAEDITILAGQTVAVSTGIAVELPLGYELQIRSRSGLALKHNVFVLNSPGTIDSDYRGEIKIILTNAGGNFTIKKGDRIAQGVLAEYCVANFKVSKSLEASARDDKGFGSTGK